MSWFNSLPLSLSLSLAPASVKLPDEYQQYSSYPTLTYGSSPALQSVGSLQYFSESFWGGDYDQYQQLPELNIVQIENTNLNFDIEITSGEVISQNNAHEPGKTTVTKVIRSVFCDPSLPVTRQYIDKLTLTDLQTGIPKDTNTVWSENTVTQKGFPEASGGGGGVN